MGLTRYVEATEDRNSGWCFAEWFRELHGLLMLVEFTAIDIALPCG